MGCLGGFFMLICWDLKTYYETADSFNSLRNALVLFVYLFSGNSKGIIKGFNLIPEV